MPYRRLPNTDSARIRALDAATKQGDIVGFLDLAYSYKLRNDALQVLSQIEQAHHEYNINLERQISNSKSYIAQLKTAKLYISHFIQVLNLSVLRNEIKKEHKRLYHLDINQQSIPDLSTEQALIDWGKYIIEGENERIRKGGAPIYNPSIAKVKVFYDNFVEAKISQKILQQNTSRSLSKLALLRENADAIILDIWNQVEEHFKDLQDDEKRKRCKKYGLVYYFRKNEKKGQHD
ncbi:MAG: hypothetical protein PHT87_04090 [Bacteroidales bacterium]|nr:hypothetical protein [Bacteroidales bacterium]MDD4641115.1 hypothetical protein [Bacteroidales bacterium]